MMATPPTPCRAKAMNSKWVCVTGGAERLGREICIAFAKRGWNVACHYRNSLKAAEATKRDVESWGVKSIILPADLGLKEEREQLMISLQVQLGGVPQVLVNNASNFEPDTAQDFSSEVMRHLLEVNLIAPLHLANLLGSMSKQERSTSVTDTTRCVIHILDQKVNNLNPDYFSYTISKLALERSVRLQAMALSPEIRVAGIAPGLIYPSGPQTLENFKYASKVNILQQSTDPQLVADAAVFIAGNSAITGVTLHVDSGQSLVPLERDIMFVVDALAEGKP